MAPGDPRAGSPHRSSEPGATVLVTDEPLSSGGSGTPVQVVDADPPDARGRS
jgi:hypothetical protein